MTVDTPGHRWNLAPYIASEDRLAYFGSFGFLKLLTELQHMVFKYPFDDAVVILPWAKRHEDRAIHPGFNYTTESLLTHLTSSLLVQD